MSFTPSERKRLQSAYFGTQSWEQAIARAEEVIGRSLDFFEAADIIGYKLTAMPSPHNDALQTWLVARRLSR